MSIPTSPTPVGIPRPAASPQVGAPVVVVVEDDPDTRALLTKLLGTKYTVFTAIDGVLALDLLAKVGPVASAVILDVMMPRVDGFGVARQMKNHPMMRHLPILFLTAKDGPRDVIEGINAGARHYLTKPFRAEEILDKVARIVAKQGPK